MSDAFKIGDWICWQTLDGLVIAEIVYIREPETYPFRPELVTNKGICHPSEVLECRRKT